MNPELLLFNLSLDLLCIAGTDGYFKRVNPAFEQTLGFTSEEFLTQPFINFVHPDDVAKTIQELEQLQTSNPTLNFENRYRCKDGSYKWLMWTAQPMLEDNVVYAIAHDITERKHTEAALRKANDQLETRVEQRTAELVKANEILQQEIAERKQLEEKFRLLFEQSSNAHLLFDEGGIIDCNNAAISMLHCTDKAHVLSLHPAVLSPEYQPDGRRSDEKCIEMDALARELGFHCFEWIHRKMDGEDFPVEVMLTPVTLHGKPALLTVWHDLTERKRVEEELHKAKEAAEAANRAKSEFLATMSHEIRTPMNGVIGMTRLLLGTQLTTQQQDFVETIRTSGDALLTIINDILDFSKIESGKLELEECPFEVGVCVEEALELLAPKAAEKGLELAYFIAPQVPETIVGDVTRLRQILVNLLSNAVKFTVAGEVVVAVTVLRQSDGAVEIQFAVKDTGIGIPASRMERLFKPFSQVDASTTRQYGGTGLGLVISQRLSTMMGGKMWVESQVNLGSTFYFTLTVRTVPNPQKGLNYSQPLTGRLLIVEENTTTQQCLALQGQAWGMLTYMATQSEALTWLQQGETFDFAILDSQIFAAEIRQQPNCQKLPLIVLTKLTQPSGEGADKISLATQVLNGDVTFLNKPVKQSQLYNALIQLMNESSTTPMLRQFQPASRLDTQDAQSQLAQRVPLQILLAEDNTVNQKVALLILKSMGYQADVAANGLEVLEALRRQPYDVVLMDVQMPKMDGLEATRRILQEWSSAKCPQIIAVTANAMQEDREECLEVGMDDYISKPIRAKSLAQVLMKCQLRKVAYQQ